MRLVSFAALGGTDFHVDTLFAMNQRWQEGGVFAMSAPRRTGALLFFRGCAATYRLPDTSVLSVPRGALLYLPQGSEYRACYTDCATGEIHTQLLEFTMTDTAGAPFTAADAPTILPAQPAALLREQFDTLVRLYTSPCFSPCAMRAEVYRLLTGLCGANAQSRAASRRFAPIAAGIRYLEEHPDENEPIEAIARRCPVSPSCFRRLFREYAGQSPAAYRAAAKLRQAERFLQSETMTVAEIARTLGYDDPAYFSRVFRRQTGMTPGEYRRARQTQTGASQTDAPEEG